MNWIALIAPLLLAGPSPAGRWQAALDLSGGTLAFVLELERHPPTWIARLCNGDDCRPAGPVRVTGDSIVITIRDYAATLEARWSARSDSMTGIYHNVGRRGPRTIPFRARRGVAAGAGGPAALLGRWNAWFQGPVESTPRVLEFRNTARGLVGTIISNSGDYGLFAGRAVGDSFAIGHFDGSFVYLLAGRLIGDTLRGTFHAGLRSQTPFVAVRGHGEAHLTPPEAVTGADTTAPFHFAFPGLDGTIVSNEDPRFTGKVVLVDIFGTWCPTCHDAAPVLVDLYRRYHDRGLEIVGLAFEVTGDSSVDGAQLRIFRDKFGIAYPLLLAGVSEAEAAAAALPQLRGFTAFPTTIFLGRDGRVRLIHAGFYGPATGEAHTQLVEEYRRVVERLLAE